MSIGIEVALRSVSEAVFGVISDVWSARGSGY